MPEEAYLACMEEYLSGVTKNDWYRCLDRERIVSSVLECFENKVKVVHDKLFCFLFISEMIF